MAQRTFLVGQRENDARLVGLGQRPQLVSLVRMRDNEETGEVVLVVLDMVFQNLQAVETCRLSMTDSCPPVLLTVGNLLGRTCRVLRLNVLHVRMLLQELAALHEGNRMRMHFGDGVPVVVRQTTDAMGDVQLMLADNGRTAVAQQLVVMQQRAGNGILNGGQSYHRRVLAHAVEHLLEGGATDELYLLTLEIEVCRNVVERPYQSLYRYSLHRTLSFISLSLKKSRFHCGCEAGPC